MSKRERRHSQLPIFWRRGASSSVKPQKTRGLANLVLMANVFGAVWSAPKVIAFPAQTSIFANTYYVDSREGDDTKAGTSSGTAWKSLEKVNATTFHPGDQILLRSSSVWRGQLWPKGSGTEAHPIIVGMYGGGVKP